MKWENERLTGEVKNVPIKSLIEELLRKEGFQWAVKGNLTGQISMSFDHLSVEQSIRKIMRVNNFDHVPVGTKSP